MMKALKERYMKKYLVGVEGIFALQTLSYFLFYCSQAEGLGVAREKKIL